MGTTTLKPSKYYADVEEFKAQNRDFVRRFYQKIRSSDIVIADLTNDNPSVHVELGMAFALNKNNLRVIGRELVRLGTDIKGQETNPYYNPEGLEKTIRQYLDRFIEIKSLPLRASNPYYAVHFHRWETLGPRPGEPLGVVYYRAPSISTQMRDGEIRVRFKIHETGANEDWFGVSLRSEAVNHPWAGAGYLLLIRENGQLQLTEMPNGKYLKRKKYPPLRRSHEYILRVRIDGSNLAACLENTPGDSLTVGNLNIQSPGEVAFGCFKSRVSLRKAQIVCRDSIDFSW